MVFSFIISTLYSVEILIKSRWLKFCHYFPTYQMTCSSSLSLKTGPLRCSKLLKFHHQPAAQCFGLYHTQTLHVSAIYRVHVRGGTRSVHMFIVYYKLSENWPTVHIYIYIYIHTYTHTVFPTRYRTRHFFNNLTTNEDIRHTTDTFLFISHTTNVPLLKFRCNIFIGVRIIKEMPGSVASGTSCSRVDITNGLHNCCLVCFRTLGDFKT
jgi:hypothetical protein